MPGTLDIAALQQTRRRFAADRDWEQFHSPKNLAMALSVEASELVDLVTDKALRQELRPFVEREAVHV